MNFNFKYRNSKHECQLAIKTHTQFHTACNKTFSIMQHPTHIPPRLLNDNALALKMHLKTGWKLFNMISFFAKFIIFHRPMSLPNKARTFRLMRNPCSRTQRDKRRRRWPGSGPQQRRPPDDAMRTYKVEDVYAHRSVLNMAEDGGDQRRRGNDPSVCSRGMTLTGLPKVRPISRVGARLTATVRRWRRLVETMPVVGSDW